MSPVSKSGKQKAASLHDITNKEVQSTKRKKLTQDEINKPILASYKKLAMEKRVQRDLVQKIKVNHQKNLEYNWKILRLQTRTLPDLQYEISKREVILRKVVRDTELLVLAIEQKEKEISQCDAKETTVLDSLKEQFKKQIQDQLHDFDTDLANQKAKWESEILELENMKPKDEVLKEIKDLETQLTSLQEKLTQLETQNNKKALGHDTELKKRFSEFKLEVEDSKIDIEEKQNTLLRKKEELAIRTRDLETLVRTYDTHIENLEKDVAIVNNQLTELDEITLPKRNALSRSTEELSHETEKTTIFQQEAYLQERKYNENFDKMEFECIRRKKLENSIDELKGFIRCFATISEEGIPSNIHVKYTSNCICNDDNGREYPFTRLIPSIDIQEKKFLFQEYRIYQDMCLKNFENHNLISVSNKQWHELRESLIKFIISNYKADYEMTFQFVFLSDDAISQDYLHSDPSQLKEGINLKFENNSIKIDSTTKTISSDFLSDTELLENIIPIDAPGVNILKVKFVKRLQKELSTEFYFLQINDLATVSALEEVFNGKDMAAGKQVSVILRYLLTYTKSCFLFNIDTQDNLDPILEVALNVGSLRNPLKPKSKSN
ncbi:hypothetical protein NCAS_0G01040 [Naumovozyma castellii]|uniref:Spindle pole body-associated protein Vik1/Cik1 microtubule binding domain-containing protein n=1 Tax=Naumovozyma castellii TaxID=27288 RepID=G0VHV7_NAUCA|nr:hypothetical protein NCAS_0G01040 [Naumovozyma castellii CBS 4309]CCC70991.1 hypothetical protein NCAS_0G01040 [Naumovozyma castellii CBS 4309]